MDIILLLGDTLYTIAGMFWKILWALILGFAISGAVQAFVPKRRMVRGYGGRQCRIAVPSRLFRRHFLVLLIRCGRHEPQRVHARCPHHGLDRVHDRGDQSRD